MSQRLVVFGDSHGDTESLRRVRDDIGDETVDYVVHVGDFTNAVREDRELAAQQLQAIEPLLGEIADQARHGLVWVWGDRDYVGEIPAELTVGTELPDDGCVTVGGQRFTASPPAVESDVILVSHMEHWRLVDHFDGRAHFCGNTHLGRHRGRRLNSGFLQYVERADGTQRYGGYFVVDVSDDGLDVTMRSIGSLERTTCGRHGDRGVQFRPADAGCMYCENELILVREMAATAFYGLATRRDSETLPIEDLVTYAVGLWDEPPAGFADDFRTYLADVDGDRYAPLEAAGSGRVRVAERSYAY